MVFFIWTISFHLFYSLMIFACIKSAACLWTGQSSIFELGFKNTKNESLDRAGCQVVLRCPHPWFIFPYVHKPNNASGLVPPRLVFIWEWCVSFGSTRLCVFFFFFIRNTSFKNLFWLHHTACEQGLNLRPRQWECEVLTNGPWGNSLHFCFFLIELFFTTVSTL